MLTTIDRSKLALCPLCSMPAIHQSPYVRADALWIRCKTCGFHACVFKDETTARKLEETENERPERAPQAG